MPPAAPHRSPYRPTRRAPRACQVCGRTAPDLVSCEGAGSRPHFFCPACGVVSRKHGSRCLACGTRLSSAARDQFRRQYKRQKRLRLLRHPAIWFTMIGGFGLALVAYLGGVTGVPALGTVVGVVALAAYLTGEVHVRVIIPRRRHRARKRRQRAKNRGSEPTLGGGKGQEEAKGEEGDPGEDRRVSRQASPWLLKHRGSGGGGGGPGADAPGGSHKGMHGRREPGTPVNPGDVARARETRARDREERATDTRTLLQGAIHAARTGDPASAREKLRAARVLAEASGELALLQIVTEWEDRLSRADDPAAPV